MELKKNAKLVFRRFNGTKGEGKYVNQAQHVNGTYLEVKVEGADKPLKIRPGQVLSIDGVAQV